MTTHDPFTTAVVLATGAVAVGALWVGTALAVVTVRTVERSRRNARARRLS